MTQNASEKENDPAHAWEGRKIIHLATTSLRPYDRNARTHSAEQIDQIIASINEWGWTNPVLIDEASMILAGHGRVMAALKMGLVTVPCIVIDGLNDAQKRAYVIADNKLALNAGWDDETLKAELMALADLEFDLSLTGFDVHEVSFLAGDDPDVTGPLPDDRYSSQYGVIVMCADEAEQELTYETLVKLNYKCKVVVT